VAIGTLREVAVADIEKAETTGRVVSGGPYMSDGIGFPKYSQIYLVRVCGEPSSDVAVEDANPLLPETPCRLYVCIFAFIKSS
jgi:hypothetical protein